MSKENMSGLVVLFGATGDLARRELLPALHQLYQRGHLAPEFAVLGVADTEMNEHEFRDLVQGTVENGRNFETLDREFLDHCHYMPLNIYDKEDFEKLKTKMETVREVFQIPSEYLYYYSIAPRLYGKTTQHLEDAEINKLTGNHRVMIEKPLGRNLETAIEYHQLINKVFTKENIYYIDHYLGMDFAQNIIATRYYNPFIESILNKDYVKNIQISLPETKDIGTRGDFYDHTGALKDMFQSHILQVLTLIGMDLPENLTTAAIHKNKVAFLKSITEFSKEKVAKQVIRGQYEGYRQTDGVAKDSNTETYIALELNIDSPKWAGVPIYVRTGKALVEGYNFVDVILKTPEQSDTEEPSHLSFGIRPEKGASFVLNQKIPKNEYKPLTTSLGPDEETIAYFYIASPYENLIGDALRGDATYFMTIEEIKEQWRITDSIVASWENLPTPDFPNYRSNSIGPNEAKGLLEKNGDKWIFREFRYL